VFLSEVLGWEFWQIGSFMAAWIIGYGLVQSLAPYLTGKRAVGARERRVPDGRTAFAWASVLAVVPATMAWLLHAEHDAQTVVVGGLSVFGVLFAINSSLHSFLIVSYAGRDGVSLDVGFYYMANAMGRLLGTLLSGWVYQVAGLGACLVISALLVALAAVASVALPRHASE
jgi:predicted MFS family arabinose efflux permease